MSIVRKGKERSEVRKLLGIKISKRIITELKQYARYVGHPINYCAEKLLEYALSGDHEFRANKRSVRKAITDPGAVEKAWNAFMAMGKNATQGKSTDASIHHDRYLYGRSVK